MTALLTVLRTDAPIVLILVPMVSALLALVGKTSPRLNRPFRSLSLLPAVVPVAVLAATLPTVVGGEAITYALGGFSAEPGIPLVLDALAWFSSALITVIVLVVGPASIPYRRFDAAYFFFLHMSAVGMQAVVLTGDIFTMFVAFEIVAIAVYVLIAWERTAQGLLASLKYLFLSSVGILFFLFGVFLVYRDLGTLSFASISDVAAALPRQFQPSIGGGREVLGGLVTVPPPGPARSLPLAVAALCVGIGVRTAFIPFHTWLPEAHAWAPHPISAMLSGVLIKISFLAMVRIITVFSATYLAPLLLWIGAITAVTAVVWALAQHDAKRLLAFHSISQMGYILAAWGAVGALGTVAAYSHAVNHALFKSLLFLVVGVMIERSGTRDVYRMRSAAAGSPVLAVGLVTGALAISGVPPFNGFVSKQLVSAALAGRPAYIMLQVASIGTAASFVKLLRILLPPAKEGAAIVPVASARRRLPVAEGYAVVVLTILVLAGGMFGGAASGTMARLVSVIPDSLGAAGPPVVPSFYSGSSVWSALRTLGFGVVVTAIVLTAPGRRVSRRISEVAPQLRAVLVFFVIGLALFAVAPLVRFSV